MRPETRTLPDEDPMGADWTFAPSRAAVPTVRRRLGDLLGEWGVVADAVGVLLLAVSELAGNAVTHAGAATEAVRVATGVAGGRAWLSVADGDPRLPLLPGAADDDAEGGRGLLIVARLLAELGGWMEVRREGAGKVVRVELPAFALSPTVCPIAA